MCYPDWLQSFENLTGTFLSHELARKGLGLKVNSQKTVQCWARESSGFQNVVSCWLHIYTLNFIYFLYFFECIFYISKKFTGQRGTIVLQYIFLKCNLDYLTLQFLKLEFAVFFLYFITCGFCGPKRSIFFFF